MSLLVILWLATGVGAAVFFLSGWLLGKARARAVLMARPDRGAQSSAGPMATATVTVADATAAPPPPVAPPVAAPLPRSVPAESPGSEALAAARTEAEHLRGELIRTRTENQRVEKELDRLRQELAQQAEDLEATRTQTHSAKEATRAAEVERARLDGELHKVRGTEADLRAALSRKQSAEEELVSRRLKMQELEKMVEQLRLERTKGQEREYQLERQVKALDPELEKTLRHDLVVARELLRTQEEKARRLDESNSELRRELETAGGRAARLESLERENQELRVRALANDLHPSGKAPTASPRPLHALANAHALQVLVGQVADLESMRAAVIGDDLGLVVACQGTHAEELAAIGALLGRASAEARKVLPLDRIQRVVLEDEGNISLTVRPLRSYDPRGAEDELTLVTLAHGAEPDPGQVARILDQQGSRPDKAEANAPEAHQSHDVREAHDAQQVGT